MSDLITIDPNEIAIFAEEGEKFVFRGDAEEHLIRLIEAQKMIEELMERVKVGIAKAGETVNPNFKGVIGDKVRCTYRQYGRKYKFVLNKKEELAPFLIAKEWLNIDTDKVDAYLEEVGELPDGIYEADREHKLSIIYKDEE